MTTEQNSPFLPIPPVVPSYSSFARKIDFTGAGITEQEILNVPLHGGQPYRLTVSNLPIVGPAGPGGVEVTVFERIGFETVFRASFVVAHGQAETLTGVGPVIVRSRSLVVNTNPQADFFLTVNPQILKEIPPMTAIEPVAGAFNTIGLNAGFPAAYRSKLTLSANGNLLLRGIDNAGVVVVDQTINLGGAFENLDIFPLQWSPLLRVQLAGGGAPAATQCAVTWSRF